MTGRWGAWLAAGLLGASLGAAGCAGRADEAEGQAARSTRRSRPPAEPRRPGAGEVLGLDRPLRGGLSGAGGMGPLGGDVRPGVLGEWGETAPSVYPALKPRRH